MFFNRDTNKRGRGSLLLVAAALLLSLALAACGDSPTPAPAANTTAAAAANGNANTTINIDISGFKFVPAEVSIPAGATVIWTNKDSVKHNVVADDNSFESPTLEKGQTFSRKFDTAATVSYYCKFHGSPGQGMTGKLTVTAGQANAAATTAAAAQATTAAAANTTAASTTAAATTAATTVVVATTAAPVVTTVAAPQLIGTVNFRDDVQLTDQLLINIEALGAAPAGRVYFGWLSNSVNNSNVNLGQLSPGGEGKVSLKYSDPKQANILASFDKFIITTETLDPTPSSPSPNVVYSGQLPGQALIHIRHLLVSFPATPNKIGLEVGLRAQVQELRRHAEFMRDAQANGDLAGVKLHAEHLVNLIEGSKGPDYGDLNKDGQVQNPGDGFGLLKNGDQLGYLEGSKEHANLAANAPDSTEEIKLHAGHVGITVDNALGWITAIRDRALSIAKAPDLKTTEPLAREILALSNQALNGVDLKGDGQILPIPGSGGVLTSYQHAQLMASIPLKSLVTGGNTSGQAQATATPDHVHPATPTGGANTAPAAATTQQASGAALGGPGKEVKIDISQFKFGSGPITIKVGTKVTWTNQDSAPHTATADSGSWDSGTLQKGQSFSFTFNKAGLVKYYCAIHGGPGGEGMSSTITVVE